MTHCHPRRYECLRIHALSHRYDLGSIVGWLVLSNDYIGQPKNRPEIIRPCKVGKFINVF
jgi:hypothetical protein